VVSEAPLDHVLEAVRAMQSGAGRRSTLVAFRPHALRGPCNEAVLFVKPEVTRPDGSVRLREVLELLVGSFGAFGIEVAGAAVLGAAYLRDHGLVAAHYGVIHAVSRLGMEALEPAAAARALAAWPGVRIVLGGHQILERFGSLTAQSLGALWDSAPSTKLASGTYARELRIGADRVVALNGFHPAQIEHFIAAGRSIVVFAVRSGSSWRDLRRRFLGATDPAKAESGSFRRALLERAAELGLERVDQGLNGAHLSAGPLEALSELVRYFADHDAHVGLDVGETVFGRALRDAGLDGLALERLLRNSRMRTRAGALVPAFDLTEELDTADAIAALRQAARTTQTQDV
jgi:hypothetical protein